MSLASTPTPNIDLLKEVRDWVRKQATTEDIYDRMRNARAAKDPQRLVWNQAQWHMKIWSDDDVFDDQSCGTACCVAGYVAVTSDEVKSIRYGEEIDFKSDPDRYATVRGYARHKLGLTEDQAYALFDGGNSAETVIRYINQIIEESESETE